MISISTALLSNTIRVGFVLIYRKKTLKNVNAEFQAKVGYYVIINHLQGYKIYGTMIKMFIPESLNSLPQPPR
jgi:hypothetical protein